MYSSHRDEKDLLNNKQSLMITSTLWSGQVEAVKTLFSNCLLAIEFLTPAACFWKKTWVIACVDKTFLGERARLALLLDCPFRTFD
jgi:hypothetical protein